MSYSILCIKNEYTLYNSLHIKLVMSKKDILQEAQDMVMLQNVWKYPIYIEDNLNRSKNSPVNQQSEIS